MIERELSCYIMMIERGLREKIKWSSEDWYSILWLLREDRVCILRWLREDWEYITMIQTVDYDDWEMIERVFYDDDDFTIS